MNAKYLYVHFQTLFSQKLIGSNLRVLYYDLYGSVESGIATYLQELKLLRADMIFREVTWVE